MMYAERDLKYFYSFPDDKEILFDNASDPEQTKNYASERPKALAYMRGELIKMLEMENKAYFTEGGKFVLPQVPPTNTRQTASASLGAAPKGHFPTHTPQWVHLLASITARPSEKETAREGQPSATAHFLQPRQSSRSKVKERQPSMPTSLRLGFIQLLGQPPTPIFIL